MGCEVVIPSAGRAGMVTTAIAGAILCVPEEEAADYRRHAPAGQEIITHPRLANLAAKRQWIYERFGDVFMADDDLEYASRVYRPGKIHLERLTPEEARQVIEMTYLNAIASGCYLFGFARTPNPKHYKPFKPIQLSGYINASAFGLRRSRHLHFDARTVAAESHWIVLLNAYHHRKSWIDTRFCFSQAQGSTFDLAGGQAGKRSMESERADTLLLRQVFGDVVKIKAGRKDAVALHRYQRTVDIPF